MHDLQKNYEDLANAIITKAVTDYRHAYALRKKYPNNSAWANTVDEIAKFFQSDYFAILTETDPQLLITMLNEEAQKQNER